MRRLVVSLLSALVLLAVAGCGDDSKDTATDPQTTTSTSAPGSTSPAEPSPSPTKGGSGSPVDHQLVTLITETDAGGEVNTTAVPLPDPAAVDAYAAQFDHGAMAADIATVASQTTVPDGQLLYAAVVSIGCTPPTDVVVTQVPNGLVVAGQKVDATQRECLAAMTTVALVIAPDVLNPR